MPTRRICCVVSAVIALMLIGAPAYAQLPDRRTFFEFNTPVEVPGVALPPGTYLFRVADPESGGKIVQVLNADGNKVYASFFSISALRPAPPDTPASSKSWNRSPTKRFARSWPRSRTEPRVESPRSKCAFC